MLSGDKSGGVLLRTLLDSGANMSIVTGQFCHRHRIPFAPCPVKLYTISGSPSGVLGEVTIAMEAVFALGQPNEARVSLRLFVMEGAEPPVFDLLLDTGVLREVGAYVDPIHAVLIYRPFRQTHENHHAFAMLPVDISRPAVAAWGPPPPRI